MIIVKCDNQFRSNRFLRSKELIKLTGLSRTTIWRLEAIGEFPSRKKLSAGAVGWLLSEVEAWISDRQAVTTINLLT